MSGGNPFTPGQTVRHLSGAVGEVRAVDGDDCWIKLAGGSRLSYHHTGLMAVRRDFGHIWVNEYRNGRWCSDSRETADRDASAGRIAVRHIHPDSHVTIDWLDGNGEVPVE